MPTAVNRFVKREIRVSRYKRSMYSVDAKPLRDRPLSILHKVLVDLYNLY